jgi:N-acyl-D-aspartate/D-glutamate deacylase
MGNCGVGFAPARPTEQQHDWLIGLLEGVEDIPGSALAEGLAWDWEDFPSYLDALARRHFAVDVGTQVAHAPLRAYVMGERGADPDEAPTADELSAMYRAVKAGLQAGALGFSTSRTYVHRTRDGAALGTRFSSTDELIALASALGDVGHGVIQMISDAYLSPDPDHAAAELDMMGQLVRAVRRPLSMTTQQPEHLPDRWRQLAAFAETMTAQGYDVKNQVAPRPIGVLLGLNASINPLMTCDSYRAVAHLPLAERVVALTDPTRRARIVAEHEGDRHEGMVAELTRGFHKMFALGDPVDYEPSPDHSVAALAAATGRRPAEVVYDLLLTHGGTQLIYMPLFNWAHENLDDVHDMLVAPRSLLGLSDAGAHCGAVCDGSFPTTMLALWGRDRRGQRLPIELLVHHLTARTAHHVGWFDRGVLAPGLLADVNIIDFDALAVHPPTMVTDLPAGGRRLMQTASGYRFTIKSGAVTFADGQHTGIHPGRLVRGPRSR